MDRIVHLSRVDIRQALDRVTGALTLRYTSKRLRFFDHAYGYPDGVFFAVNLKELPLPEALMTLANAVGIVLDDLPLANELRRAVAEVLASEAMMEAPDYLSMIANPRTAWIAPDMRELERRNLAAEARVSELSRLVEASLRRRIQQPTILPPIRTYEAMPPAGYIDVRQAPVPLRELPMDREEPAEETEETIEVEEHVSSEATAKRVRDAIQAAREQELPQRLPAGARRALARQPAGLFISHGSSLDRKTDLCAAMMDGAESGKRSGESVLIDWDGEWPVVARRYGAHGRIVYRVEDALRRNGIAPGVAA